MTTTLTLGKKGRLARQESPYSLEPVKAEGDFLFDKSGKKYIDFLMGWCVGNLGWGNNRLQEVIKNYSGPDYVYPQLTYTPWDELAGLLGEVAPGDLSVCYRTTGGSESVETAMQIAMAYTDRKKFISLEDSYHGNTIGAMSIGATESKEKFPHLLTGCEKIEIPLEEKTLRKIETKLKTKEFAGFIMEPVVLNNGVYIPSPDFMKGLQRLCHKYGTLLVIDEVACGFFRTGKFFATEHFDIEPDIFCLGKAITNGSAGMGATMTTAKIGSKIKNKLNVYSTYGWHPLSTAVAIANLNYLIENKEELEEKILKRSMQIRTALSQMAFKKGGKLSIIGMAIAVDLEDKKYAGKVAESCFNKGLLLSQQENKLTMFPSTTIAENTVNEAMEILSESC